MSGSSDVYYRVAEALLNSRYAIAFTGAGVSAESGIPTFRGRDGLWRKYRAEELATPQAFQRNPELVWRWYSWRLENVLKAEPNSAHKVLARLEDMGLLKCVITQNVDELHRTAGSKCVVELHGSIRRARCIECGYRVRLDKPPTQIPPQCPRCNGLLRPDVVWFGEPLPESAWREAVDHASRADLVLVIGTSGVVYPAAYIPLIVKDHGGVVVEINVSDTGLTSIADYVLRGKAGVVLSKLYGIIEDKMDIGISSV